MIHKTEIENYNGSMQELIDEIGNLRYDSLSIFLNLLAEKIERDGFKDRSRKRIKLATNLENASALLKQAKLEIDSAWKICEPYV